MKDSQALTYNRITGHIDIIDKNKVLNIVKNKDLKLTMSYKEITKNSSFNIYDKNIYGYNIDNSNILIILIDKDLEDFKTFIRKHNYILEEDLTILYHGSKAGLTLPINLNLCSLQCDFGQAFYLATNKEQPSELISNEDNPCPTLYEFKPNLTGLSIFKFQNDKNWALYVARNRGSHKVLNNSKIMSYLSKFDNYDILEGTIADDRFASTLKEFFRGNIHLKTLIDSLDYFKYGTQLAFKTNKACERLNVSLVNSTKLSSQEIQKYMLEVIQKKHNIDEKLEELKESQRNIQSPYFNDILKEFE